MCRTTRNFAYRTSSMLLGLRIKPPNLTPAARFRMRITAMTLGTRRSPRASPMGMLYLQRRNTNTTKKITASPAPRVPQVPSQREGGEVQEANAYRKATGTIGTLHSLPMAMAPARISLGGPERLLVPATPVPWGNPERWEM